MKAVVDTNVFVSSFFGGNPKKVIDLWKTGALTLCLSKDILDEYIDILQTLGLKDEEELKELLALFSGGHNLLFTTKTPTIKAVEKDPGDDKFIECAVGLKADVIITGDKVLEILREYAGIKILTPQRFLSVFFPGQK